MSNIKLKEGDEIFSNGVFLKALKVIINGKEQVRWVVTSFEDTSYFNGEEVDVFAYAETASSLMEYSRKTN